MQSEVEKKAKRKYTPAPKICEHDALTALMDALALAEEQMEKVKEIYDDPDHGRWVMEVDSHIQEAIKWMAGVIQFAENECKTCNEEELVTQLQ
jgi:hypothetical protein